MPSTTLVHSFPGSLGRRGTVALAVGGLHLVLVAALVAGLAIRPPIEVFIPLEGVQPPARTPVDPPRVPLAPSDTDIAQSIPRDTFAPPDEVVPRDDGPLDTGPVGPTDVVGEPGPATTTITLAPRVLRTEQPPYPAAARRLGEEGAVVLRVRVDAHGRAEIVEVATSSGSPRLDEAAVRSVQRWRFDPARAGAETIAGWVSLKVTFRLTD